MPQAGKPDRESFLAGLADLREFVKALPAAYGIDPARLFVMGFSQGAILGSALAMETPDTVRGIVMHSGYVPQALGNAGFGITAGGLAGKPFFVAHGKYDDVLPVGFARDSHEYLQQAGADVVYQEYPIGHSISEESLYDLSEWLTGQLDRA
jgi:phospholipase/carboxylesterase